MTTTTSDLFASIRVELIDEGDDGATFRLRNAPGEIQRPYILDRLSRNLHLQGNLLCVIHGRWTPGGAPATLIIARFSFLGGNSSKHFRSATITFSFSQRTTRNSECPEVVSIAPSGHFSLNVSQVVEETKRTTNAGAEIPVPGTGAKVHGGRAWELTQSTERADRGTLIGVIRVEGRFSGPSIRNTARWYLTENSTQKDGLPTSLQVAILLKRRNMHQFQAEINVKADVDRVYAMQSSIRRFTGQRVDPIIFDPNIPPDNLSIPGGISVDPSNLGLMASTLNNLFAVHSTTVIESTPQPHFDPWLSSRN